MHFGCHISTKNGYLGAAKTAIDIGAKAFQYFPKNPRSLKTKEFNHKDAERCASFCQEHEIVSIGHSAYASNLSADTHKIDAVVQCILNDLEITNACGSIGTVVHFGSYHGDDPLEGYKRMIVALNDTLSQWNGKSLILLENNAGKGDQLGTTLEELVKIRSLTNYPEKIGFCLDTCHAFASGIWNGENWQDVVNTGISIGYFDHLKAVHLNNSVYPYGSKKDRHANILHGEIAVQSFKDFLTSDQVKDIPLILETPSSEKYNHQQEIMDLYKLTQ